MAASTNFTVADLLVGFEISDGMRVTVLTLGWLACVNGVFGNVLIITTLLSQQALRSMHNIYIANLALADLLVVGYVMVFFLLDLKLGYQPVARNISPDVYVFLLLLSFINNSINWIIYGLMNKNFLRGYKRLMGFAPGTPASKQLGKSAYK
nr:hypothetical protein BaRGS_024352 [Batillaria attramentaria]